MAPSKSNGGSVEYKVNADGQHQVGVTVDGVFVPFASLEGSYVDHLVSAGKTPEAEAATDDDENGGK